MNEEAKEMVAQLMIVQALIHRGRSDLGDECFAQDRVGQLLLDAMETLENRTVSYTFMSLGI